MSKPDALALADRIETATANVDLEGIVRIQISSYDLDHASSELRRLHYENEALRKDAERYRWQYSGAKTDSDALVNIQIRMIHGEVPALEEVRAAFDAAMKEKQHG